jgi:hypothetical protein
VEAIYMAKAKKEKFECLYCGKSYVDTSYYNSNSIFYSNGKLPYCKQCIEKLYQNLLDKYTNDGDLYPERRAVKRLCMAFDVYYKEDVFNSALKNFRESEVKTSPMSQYMRIIQLFQYNRYKETYDNTIVNEERIMQIQSDINIDMYTDESDDFKVDEKTINFFGAGFRDEDYKFLQREYDDWTARHECKTKTQEEIFKDICFNRLQNWRALQRGEETKDITAAFQKMLDSGKLQPKQNSGDTMADNQTFGTLIDKWENTRPLPEIDDELKDVDKIGWYIDVFFKGHLSKMMGLKNGLSNMYTKFMKKYSVEKPEYSDEENSEILFDAIFGNPSFEDDKVVD